jgi:hypothetical protein
MQQSRSLFYECCSFEIFAGGMPGVHFPRSAGKAITRTVVMRALLTIGTVF